jgi:6-phosphofructokinase 1
LVVVSKSDILNYLIEEYAAMGKSFAIETLGPGKVPSPIGLSTISGDFRANYVTDDTCIRYDADVIKDSDGNPKPSKRPAQLVEKAGPREFIYFKPQHVNAGICTCGGLCPGLNDVIRAVVRCLWNRYGVRRIRGIRYGFKGFFAESGYDTIDLDPDVVDNIHKTGGSFLGTSRGGGNRVTDIVDSIESLNMNMVFIVGGDGTQRGALEIAEEIEKRGLKVAIVGIPKTIDNDLAFISHTFGFDTAVQQATEAVGAAHK